MSMSINFNGKSANNEGELTVFAALPNMVSLNRMCSVVNNVCNKPENDTVIMFSGQNGMYFMTKEDQETYYTLDDYFCDTSVSELMNFVFKFEDDEIKTKNEFEIQWIDNVETEYNNGKLTHAIITLNPIPGLDNKVDKTRSFKIDVIINNEYEPIFTNKNYCH